EFESAFHKKINTKEDVIHIARDIINQGVSYVCVSMGKAGAILVTKDQAYLAPPLKLDIKGVQGAGDSLVAGICLAIDKGLSDAEMLKYGVTVASGSLLHEGTRLCEKKDFDDIYQQIVIEKL
ncbi:1-phosphofructokinase, partial [Lachnotalea glycerini]